MKTVIVVSPNAVFTNITKGILASYFHVIAFNSVDAALEFIYNEIPDLVIVEITAKEEAAIEGLNGVKGDPLFSQIPVIAVFKDESVIRDWESLLVEDYLFNSDIEKELLPRVKLGITRSARVVQINPLTKLPGNISINRQIQERLERGEAFAFAYADICDFKPFNDRYGFSRGDEVIQVTGRLIFNIVKSKQTDGSFVGHIGGDDFVFIMEKGLIQEACKDIIDAFDSIIPTFYDAEDRENNGIKSVDRQGVVMSFPFIGLAIGVTDTADRSFSHFGQLTGVASEMKNLAKKKTGSSFRIDKRATKRS
jgi:diguanylate cyclase (GGDEF)-like protein